MPDHYFSKKPKSVANERVFTCRLRNRSFNFKSAAGTFAKYRVDSATKLLIENADVIKKSRILDIGCGIGIIGIALGLTLNAKVVMVEINLRAARLAKENARLNGVEATVLQGDLYDPVGDELFDVILTNPPMAAGREICYSIIEGGPSHLKKGGSLQLVAKHRKGGAMLEKHMISVFGNCDVLAKGGGFRVYRSYY